MKDYSASEKIIVDVLKALIEDKGYDYIYNYPYDTYQYLCRNTDIETELSSVILYALVSKIGKRAKKRSSIKAKMTTTMFLDAEMSEVVLNIFSSLYGEKNLTEMAKGEYKGLEEFFSKEWSFTIGSEATWEGKHGPSKDYSVELDFTIKVRNKKTVENEFKTKLKINPFLTANDILNYYIDCLEQDLDAEFCEYCQSDDYYEPVVDDFYIERDQHFEKLLKQYGLKFVSVDWSYDESDYYFD